MNSHDPEDLPSDDAAARAATRELFERSVDRIDVATGNRLRLMRRDALATSAPHASTSLRRWLPATFAASFALLLGLAWWLPRVPDQAAVTAPERIDASESVYPAEDEVELYAWLGEAPVAVDTQGDAL